MVAIGAVSGCASEEIGGYSERSDEAPDCGDVWVIGDSLPADYDGCNDRSGAFSPRIEVAEDCELTSIVVGQTVFFAELGGQIGESALSTLLEDEDYSRALDMCSIPEQPD